MPYRDIDQSGVLFTALAFGSAIVLSDVGGFPEVARDGAAQLVPPGDPTALRESLRRLLSDDAARARLAEGSARAAHARYAWATIAAQHLQLYERLTRTA